MNSKERKNYHSNFIKPYVCKSCWRKRKHIYPNCKIGCKTYTIWKDYDMNKDWSQWEYKSWKGDNND